MKTRLSIGLLLSAGVLAGCGSGTATNTSPSASPTASPTPEPEALIVIADYPQSAPETTPTTIHLVRLDGTEANRFTVKAGASSTTARGSRVFVLDKSALTALHRDGTVEDLGTLGSMSPSGSLVASPDGNTWLWSTLDTNGKGTLYVGSKGASSRVVEQSTETGRSIRPYSWTQRGPAAEHGAMGIGGYILFFTATGPIDIVEPVSGKATPLNHTSDCSFSDVATDGTIACFPHGSTNTLSLIADNGQVTTVKLAQDAFAREGAAYFSPNGEQVIVGGATGAGAGHEVFAASLVNTSDGSVHPLLLDGVRPANGNWAWMADGSLIVYRPSFAAAGGGVWLVRPGGAATKLASGGEPIGVLTA
jgi:hypothetical protein